MDRKDRKRTETDDVEVDVCHHLSCNRLFDSPSTSKLPDIPLRLIFLLHFIKLPCIYVTLRT